jgi:hypothetical protein
MPCAPSGSNRIKEEEEESFQQHYGPGVDIAYNRNEYQESSWGKGWPARKADNLTAICEPIF